MRKLKPACRLMLFVLLGLLSAGGTADAADWPMFGRDATRNPVSLEQVPPLDWDIGSFDRRTGRWLEDGHNIRWTANLGTGVYASPVISDGLVWIGANSLGLDGGRDERKAALLRCYRESDGQLLYEYVSPRIEGNSRRDPPWHGLSCSPSTQGDRLWFFTNRCETVCLDIASLKRGDGEPQVVCKTDLKDLGIHLRPLWMWPGRICSPSQPYNGRIYVTVPNGVDDMLGGFNVPAPEAPSLVCLDKDTGEVVWTDNSSSANVLYSEFSSPLVANIGGRGQVVVAQGDGWVRSFEPGSGKLIWQFDSNPKTSDYTFSGGTRNYFLATPVLYEERIYIGNGRQASRGEGPGRLVCIDPTKTGDISIELAVDREGKPLPRRRRQAVDPQKGEKAIPNPNSGLIWEFTADAEEFQDQMHRTLSSVAVHKGLVIAPAYSGLVHCLDARTGKKYWTYDGPSRIWGSPLIVGETIYVADEDGFVALLRLSSDPSVAMDNAELIPQIDMRNSVCMSPVFANGTLYVCDRYRLYAIENQQQQARRRKTSAIYADGHLVARQADGEMRLIEATPKGYVEKGAFTIPDHEPSISATAPVIAGGRLYLQDKNRLFCYDVRGSEFEKLRPDPKTIATAGPDSQPRSRGGPRSVFVPTPHDVVEKMLELAAVQKKDVVYDLGSGDGRIVIAAAKKYGCRAIGYEIDRELVELSRDKAREAGVERLVTIEGKDIFDADLSSADVVAVYLLPKQLEELIPQFQTLKPGSRIVSHYFGIPGIEPEKTFLIESRDDGEEHTIYLWTGPLKNKPSQSQ